MQEVNYTNMREIITLQVGQCGNRVGKSFWEQVIEEGQDAQGIFLAESRGGQHIARAVLCDLQSNGLDDIRASPIGSIFRSDSYLARGCGTGNNWAKGHYTEGAEYHDEIFDIVRLQFEACDKPEGIQVFMSLGGGTGSGLGTKLISSFRENFPANMLISNTIFPSSKGNSDCVVEPYNTTLSVHQLVENTDLTLCFDNQALFDIAKRGYGIQKPTFEDINKPMVTSLSALTSSMRFPGNLNTNLRKIAVNMVPYPRLHFFTTSVAPMGVDAQLAVKSPNELAKSMFDSKNCLCSVNSKHGRYYTATAFFRGDISSYEAELAVQQLQYRNSSYFVEWIPNNISVSYSRLPVNNQPASAVLLGSTSAIQELFKRVSEQFTTMFRRKAFLHFYTGEGMDEMEFTEAESNMNDLVSEYQGPWHGMAEEDEGEEEIQG